MSSRDVYFDRVHYGADYNPDQWPTDIWDEDVRLMGEASVTMVSVPIFGWVSLQPDEQTFSPGWLDTVLDKLHAGGVSACLATATASVPAWVAQQYPDVLVTDADGVRRRHGGRHAFCPSSPNFRRLSTDLVRKIATRYADHPALRLWHVGNEYGTTCYCDLCAERFREWLRERYETLDELNRRWNTAFWSHTYTAWSQIEPPYTNGEASIQALTIEWKRFASDALLGCLRAEVDVIREVTPDVPVTTNLMGPFPRLDYHRWAEHIDIVSWDNYPRPHDPPATVAFNHALMRGLKEGQPFLLLEQSPSQQNWQAYNWLKPPGLLRLQSYQAVAQGSDAVMYFQWRRSAAGIEKLHGAVVEHHGRSDARVFREVAELGAELGSLGSTTVGGRMDTRAAVLFDWSNWWSLMASSGPSHDLDYVAECRKAFAALYELGIQPEVLSPRADLSGYDLIVAPVLTMIDEPDAERLAECVRNGATFLATPFTGLVNSDDMVHSGGAPGPLSELFGVTVEETDACPPDRTNGVRLESPLGDPDNPLGSLGAGTVLDSGVLCERVWLEGSDGASGAVSSGASGAVSSGASGAEIVGTYVRDFYAGEPSLTRNRYGDGRAYVLATLPTQRALRDLLAGLCAERGMSSPLGAPPPEGVEVTRRVGPEAAVLYLLNHGADEVTVRLSEGQAYVDLLTGESCAGSVTLPHRGVRLLRES